MKARRRVAGRSCNVLAFAKAEGCAAVAVFEDGRFVCFELCPADPGDEEKKETAMSEDRYVHVQARGVKGEIDMGEPKRDEGTGEVKGSPFVAAVFEICSGRKSGTRMQWTGSLSEKAAEYTIEALRAAGWKGSAFGQWDGFGDAIVDLSLEQRPERNPQRGQEARLFWEIAFVNRLRRVHVKDPVNETVAGDLSKKYADLLRPAEEPEGEEIPF